MTESLRLHGQTARGRCSCRGLVFPARKMQPCNDHPTQWHSHKLLRFRQTWSAPAASCMARRQLGDSNVSVSQLCFGRRPPPTQPCSIPFARHATWRCFCCYRVRDARREACHGLTPAGALDRNHALWREHVRSSSAPAAVSSS